MACSSEIETRGLDVAKRTMYQRAIKQGDMLFSGLDGERFIVGCERFGVTREQKQCVGAIDVDGAQSGRQLERRFKINQSILLQTHRAENESPVVVRGCQRLCIYARALNQDIAG